MFNQIAQREIQKTLADGFNHPAKNNSAANFPSPLLFQREGGWGMSSKGNSPPSPLSCEEKGSSNTDSIAASDGISSDGMI